MDEFEPFRALLLDKRRQTREQIAVLQATIREETDARRDTPMDDEHDPEGSTVSLDLARDVGLLAGTENSLEEIDAALQRLAEGTYGSCENCGQPIPRERLEARPEARLCVPCTQLRRRRGHPG